MTTVHLLLTSLPFLVATLGGKLWMKRALSIVNVFEMIQEEYAEEGLVMPEDVELVKRECQLNYGTNLCLI